MDYNEQTIGDFHDDVILLQLPESSRKLRHGSLVICWKKQGGGLDPK